MNQEIPLKEAVIPLHIISLSGKHLRGKTRLHKLVFLSQMKSKNKFNFEFSSAPRGPLSSKLNQSLDRFKKLGLVEENRESTQGGNEVILYKLTTDGKKLVEFGTKAYLDSKTIKTNEEIVKEYGDMSYLDLLDYVHTKYPEYQLKFS